MTQRAKDTTILLLSTSSGPGGAERMISSLAASLNQSGFRVIVGLFRPGWLKEQCESKGVDVRVLPIKGLLGWRWFRECLTLVRHEGVSLIHAHEFSAIMCGWMVARLVGLPFVGTIHGKNYFWEKLRRRMAYRIISRSGRLVAVSEDLKRFVMDTVGLPGTRVQVIYNGVQIGSPVSDDDVARCRAELGLKASDLVIGSIGSLYPVKGHEYLLDAMPAILQQHPRTVLLLVGRGDLDVSLKEQAKRLGIEQQVRFLGMRHDVAKLLALMEVFVLPSLSEGLSIALLEAMAAGKAVVATRVGGNAELILENETGILVPPKDPATLTKALHQLLDNRAMREAFGHRATRRIQRQFSARLMTDGYKRLYNDLLRSNE